VGDFVGDGVGAAASQQIEAYADWYFVFNSSLAPIRPFSVLQVTAVAAKPGCGRLGSEPPSAVAGAFVGAEVAATFALQAPAVSV
jgi:hypothetical protein